MQINHPPSAVTLDSNMSAANCFAHRSRMRGRVLAFEEESESERERERENARKRERAQDLALERLGALRPTIVNTV